MAKFRKKPVVIEAEQYRLGLEDGFMTITEAGCHGLSMAGVNQPMCAMSIGSGRDVPFIETLEGKHFISEGDWIITGVEGERYPCKDSVFKKTYEPVED